VASVRVLALALAEMGALAPTDSAGLAPGGPPSCSQPW